MTQILVQGATVLACGPFIDTGDALHAPDLVIPKAALGAYSLVEVQLPVPFAVNAYTWDGANLVPVVVPPPVPQEVPMASARKVLRRHGYPDATVRNQIAASSLTALQQADALDDWEYKTVVQRTAPLTVAMMGILGITPAQADAMFIEAAALQ